MWQGDFNRVLGIRRRVYALGDFSLQGKSFVATNVAKVLGVLGVVGFAGWQLGVSPMPSWLSAGFYVILPLMLIFFIFRPVADDMKVHEWLGVLLKHRITPRRGYGFGCPRPPARGVISAEVWTQKEKDVWK
jgi:hypothetical protein